MNIHAALLRFLHNIKSKLVFTQSRPEATGQKATQSNGMDSSSPKRHLGAKLEVSSTSEQKEGVHHEDYPRWGRFGKECISGAWR
jgi:hypothetical protein